MTRTIGPSSLAIVALATIGMNAWSTGAGAAEGLYLSWNECALSPASSPQHAPACDTETGEHTLFTAFTLPFAVDSVIALEIVIDLQISGTSLPPWWEFQEKGCHQNALLATAAPAPGTPCGDPWGVPATEAVSYYPGEPRGGPSQARVKINVAVLPGLYRRLEPNVMYHAARLRFQNFGTSLCTGCLQSGCLVLNSITIGRLPGAPGGNLLLEAPGPGSANRATWNGGAQHCDAVPVRSRTWAQLKALYR
jgi:hypothetical protein